MRRPCAGTTGAGSPACAPSLPPSSPSSPSAGCANAYAEEPATGTALDYTLPSPSARARRRRPCPASRDPEARSRPLHVPRRVRRLRRLLDGRGLERRKDVRGRPPPSRVGSISRACRASLQRLRGARGAQADRDLRAPRVARRAVRHRPPRLQPRRSSRTDRACPRRSRLRGRLAQRGQRIAFLGAFDPVNTQMGSRMGRRAHRHGARLVRRRPVQRRQRAPKSTRDPKTIRAAASRGSPLTTSLMSTGAVASELQRADDGRQSPRRQDWHHGEVGHGELPRNTREMRAGTRRHSSLAAAYFCRRYTAGCPRTWSRRGREQVERADDARKPMLPVRATPPGLVTSLSVHPMHVAAPGTSVKDRGRTR